MSGKELLRGLSHVDEAFVADAMAEGPARRRPWRKYAAAAACIALLAGAALWWNGRPYVIRMDQVAVNPVSSVRPAQPSYDPAAVRAVSWDSAQIAEYYGRDLTPAYVPENLAQANREPTGEVLVTEDGLVVFDAVELDFYAGEPARGFSLTVSTEETLIYEYADPETGRKRFSVNGVEVTLGEILVTDASGEQPSFGAYTAEFALDDLCYALRFQQMEMAEVLKVVASIIQGDSNIVVE